jgi:hypothetical protein
MSRSNPKAVRDATTGETKLVKRLSPPRKDKVFRRLEASVPREEWLAACESSTDERATMLLARLMDPAYRKHSLPTLAKEVGLTYPQVLKMVTQHRLDQGLLRMSAHVPQVLEDVAIDSLSKDVTCGACRGFKVDDVAVVAVTEGVLDPETKRTVIVQKLDDEGRPVWERCLVCDGAGTLRKVGDKAARELMFETLQLTGKRGPMIAQQFINAGGQSVEDALDTVASVLDVKAGVPTT